MLATDVPLPQANAGLRQKHVQQLMKTEMCKFFLRKNCGKGAKCAYAHSFAEVREKPNLCRTSMCRSFLQTGNCDNPDCSFAHNERQLRTTCGFFKTKMCRFAGSGRCKHGTTCRFAHNKDELYQLDDSATVPGLTSASKSNQQDYFDITSDQSTQTPEVSGESGPEEMLKKDREKKQDGSRPARHCTTMMLSNVPHFLTQGALVSLLEDLTLGMRGAFDFFYCPWDPYEDKNLGYAIINFFSRSVAADFEKQWANKPLLQGTRGMKKLRIVPAALQGRAANLRHFSGFGLAHHADPRFRPLVRAGLNECLRPMAVTEEMADGCDANDHSRQLQSTAPHSVERDGFEMLPLLLSGNFRQDRQQAMMQQHTQRLASASPPDVLLPPEPSMSDTQPAKCSYAENLMGLLQQIGRNPESGGSGARMLCRRLAGEPVVSQPPPLATPNVALHGLPSVYGEALLQSLQLNGHVRPGRQSDVVSVEPAASNSF